MDADSVIKPGTLCVIVGSGVLETLLGRFVTIRTAERWYIAMHINGAIDRTFAFEVDFVGEPPTHPCSVKAYDWVVPRPNLLPVNDPDAFARGPVTTRVPEIEGHTA